MPCCCDWAPPPFGAARPSRRAQHEGAATSTPGTWRRYACRCSPERDSPKSSTSESRTVCDLVGGPGHRPRGLICCTQWHVLG